jgi:murein DD-endopeptidase MepM/ murein hydrolase activator NlpD
MIFLLRRTSGFVRYVVAALFIASGLVMAANVEVVPGTVIRWPAPGADRCQVAERSWPTLGGQCFFPIDLLEARDSIELIQWRGAESESARVRVGTYPYKVQRIQLADDKRVHLSERDLARVLAEQERVAALWELDGPREFALPLQAPLAAMPAGGRFGVKRIINGEPRNPHSGADFASPAGTSVRAGADGRVVLSEEHFFGGRSLFVHHGDGLITMYLHLSRAGVDVGDWVSRGQTIGAVGSSGRATGPHLHFGVRWHGARVDPLPLLGAVDHIPAISR